MTSRNRRLDHAGRRRGAYAARILQDQLQVFINFEEPKQLKPAEEARCRAAVQPGSAQEGGRARAVGSFGQLPEERQHRLHRRPDPRSRKRKCCAPRTSAASRSTRSRKCSRNAMGLHLGMEVPRLAAGEHRTVDVTAKGKDSGPVEVADDAENAA
jgi:hypothetical protein